MLQQIILTTIVLPFVMGLVIAATGRLGLSRGMVLTALLVPLAAAVAHATIEGFPALPPVAAKHKFPVILVIGGIAFAVLAALLPRLQSKALGAVLAVVSLVPSIWWLGRNVLASNSGKAAVVAILFVIAVSALTLASTANRERRTASSVAFPASLLWVSIASALAAVCGGYIGMAQMNGALAALAGGWLLVAYVRYIRGNDDAFALEGVGALAFGWTAIIALIMTALLAPAAAPAALILAILPIPAALLIDRRGITFEGLARAIRPLAIGLLIAIPAIAGIIIAVVLAEG